MLKGSDAEIIAGIKQSSYGERQIPPLLAHSQPERLEKLMDGGLKFKDVTAAYGQMALANPDGYAPKAFAVFEKLQDRNPRVHLITTLAEAVPGKYMDRAHEEVSACFCQDPDDVMGRFCAEFLLKHGLPDALELTCKWMAGFDGGNSWNSPLLRELVIKWASENQPKLVQPMAEACTSCPAGNVALLGLKYWKQHGIGDASDRYYEAIKRLLANADPSAIVSGITEAREWDIRRTNADIWPLMLHKSRPVRGAAARALAGMGYAESGERWSNSWRTKTRTCGRQQCYCSADIAARRVWRALKQHLDLEENDDVRDSILLALESSGSGAALSPAEQQERIVKTLAKSKSPPSAWIKTDTLAFKKRDGHALTTDEVLYLLIRQSRCKEMRADLEAKPLYAELDRKASADAALTLLQGFMGTTQAASDRWFSRSPHSRVTTGSWPVLPRPSSTGRTKSWHSGGVWRTTLALLGTEAALMVVDSLSVRFAARTKTSARPRRMVRLGSGGAWGHRGGIGRPRRAVARI